MASIDKKNQSNIQLVPGLRIAFEPISLSESEIIEFANQFDPLDFHVNKEIALKGPFKSIIASGPHIFTLVHKSEWIPLFGKTVLAGVELNNWKFLKPVYPNQKIFSFVTILSVKENIEKKHIAVNWLYEFKNEAEEMVQSLEMIILHNLVPGR